MDVTLAWAWALISAAWRITVCSAVLLMDRNFPISGESGLRIEPEILSMTPSCSVAEGPARYLSKDLGLFLEPFGSGLGKSTNTWWYSGSRDFK